MRKVFLLYICLMFALGAIGYFKFIKADTPAATDQSQAEGPSSVPIASAELPRVAGATNSTDQTDNTEAPASNPSDVIRIAAMGDMIPHETVVKRAKSGNDYDFAQYFEKVSASMDDADIRFCNQESPTAGEGLGLSGYPTFNAPKQFSRDLNEVGCDLVNLANNHMADKNQTGINATLDTWSKYKSTIVTGANKSKVQQDTIKTIEVKGKTIAFVAFTDLSNNTAIESYSINMFSEALVKKLVSKADETADFVVVSAHWGTEDVEAVNAGQKKWAKLLAENGADVIIGTGPHRVQTADTLIGKDGKDTVVLYSIGNFLSSQLTIEQLTAGIAYINIPLDASATPTIEFMPTYMSYSWSSADEQSQNLLARDNLMLYPMDDANTVIKQRFNTSATAQTSRLKKLLNQNIPVEFIDPK